MHFADNLVLSTYALAMALSKELKDDEIEILAALFTQLGDTLETISAAKSFYESKKSDQS